MLCTGNIQIKFFELDDEEREVWSAYGSFTDGDVHHQYAIVFKLVFSHLELTQRHLINVLS